MDDRERERLQLSAAWSRPFLGLMAAVLLPLAYPGLSRVSWIFGAYVVATLFSQVLIYKHIGGVVRSVVGGLIDLSLLTFLVHRVGSVGTMLVSIYFFAVIVNTLVVGRRVGIALSILSSLAYGLVVLAETTGVISYGPDAPLGVRAVPGHVEAMVVTGLFSTLLVASAVLVGLLVSKTHRREAELVAANAKLEELSLRDPLTQLFNRRHLMARVEAELARSRRGHPLAVVMIDLDRFKRVNDDEGHQKGDEVLREIADALAEATREVDVPGRYGGDEFVVVLPDTGHQAALAVAERLCSAVRGVGVRYDADAPVTASVGLATALPEDGARALIQRADQLAYEAKRAGGDGVRASAAPVASAEWEASDQTGVRPKKRARSRRRNA